MQDQEILEKLLDAEKGRPEVSNARRARGPRSCDHWSLPVLLERAAYLRKLAMLGEGSASETIKEYQGYKATLYIQVRNGMAEMHGEFDEIFIVLDGHAILASGGTLEKGQQSAPGEMRAPAIIGGSRQELQAGDVLHVSAGTPHQVLLCGDDTLSCLVVKIRKCAGL